MPERTTAVPNGNLGLLLAHPWHETSLGPFGGWPAEMQSLTRSIMGSAFPICTAWGADGVQIYNDAYTAIFGEKHPHAFGAPLRQSWGEIWSFLERAVGEVLREGRTIAFEAMLMPLVRRGRPEECYFDFSYSPVVAADGSTLGLMSVASDRTSEVVFRRRRACSERLDRLAREHAHTSGVREGLRALLQSNAMDAAAAMLLQHGCDGAATVLWDYGLAPGLVDLLRSAPGPHAAGVNRVPLQASAAPKGCADFVHVVPVFDRRGHLALRLAVCPHALVTAESHAGFCEELARQVQGLFRQMERQREELRRLQDGYKESEAFYRFLFEEMEDAAFYTVLDTGPDATELVHAANHRACLMLGYAPAELAGVHRDVLFFPDDQVLRRAVKERSRSGVFVGQLTARRKDGAALPIEIASRLVTLRNGEVRSVNIVRDISQRLKAEKQRAERAKVESLVQLTGGIAHDFNNFLSAILVSLDALCDELPPCAPARSFAESAMLGAERAASLTRQLLTYAKQQSLQAEDLHVQAFVPEIAGLLQSTAGDKVRLDFDLEKDLPSCRLDPAQLTSALLNLIANARDAMPAGGRCLVRARQQQLACEDLAADGHRLPPGSYIGLAVQDEGTGMPEEVLSRIFEPFFTTKAQEGGSGLGMPMVQGFTRQAGGDVRITTAPGRGTCVELLLPVASGKGQPIAPQGASVAPPLPSHVPSGSL